MSTTKGLERIDHGGSVTVVDEQTGISGTGDTYSEALEELVQHFRSTQEIAALLEGADELSETDDTIQKVATAIEDLRETTAFIGLSKDVKDRFDEESISDEDVEDAIEWARSE